MLQERYITGQNERQQKRNQDEMCTSGDGAMKEDRFPHPGSPFAICDAHQDRVGVAWTLL